MNTLLKNRELTEQLYDYLLPYYKEGLDAVIVQDMGVFAAIRELFPGMHLHASTQMTVTGPAGMKFLEEPGSLPRGNCQRAVSGGNPTDA